MLGYDVSQRERWLSYCVDQHRHLVYNLNSLESPSVLSAKLGSKNIELVQADARHIYYASLPAKKKIVSRSAKTGVKKNIFDTFTAVAEAKSSR